MSPTNAMCEEQNDINKFAKLQLKAFIYLYYYSYSIRNEKRGRKQNDSISIVFSCSIQAGSRLLMHDCANEYEWENLWFKMTNSRALSLSLYHSSNRCTYFPPCGMNVCVCGKIYKFKAILIFNCVRI